MNILLTNDDGINSEGLKKLENVLKEYGDVFVVAPMVEQSGKACSINSFKGIKVKKIDKNHIAVDGSPVDCVEVGIALLNKDIDLVVSGCNNGYNLNNDIMYSGTCGACVQACFAGINAIAFSIANKNYFDLIESKAKRVLDYIFSNNLLEKGYYFNVNLPTYEEDLGIKITKVVDKVLETYYPGEEDEDGKFIIYRKFLKEIDDVDSDYVSVLKGYISITPMSQSTFNKDFYNLVKSKV